MHPASLAAKASAAQDSTGSCREAGCSSALLKRATPFSTVSSLGTNETQQLWVQMKGSTFGHR